MEFKCRRCLAPVPTGCTPLKSNVCTGYLLGTYDSMVAAGLICPGANASTLQALAIGRKFLADNPEAWDKLAASVVGAAYKRAFPCPSAKR